MVEQLQSLIREAGMGERVQLAGTFWMGNCQPVVCVTVNDDFFSVSPDTVKGFFEENILSKV